MGSHVVTNGLAVKGESWKPHAPEGDQNVMVILGEVQVKDSKDVVYDNLTVFEGPVTVERVEDQKESNDDGVKYLQRNCCRRRVVVASVIVGLVVVAVAASLIATLGKKHSGELIKRERWGGMDPVQPADNLTLPVPYVIISHTATDFCFTFDDCSSTVRSVQNFHMISRNWWDIGYNFLVGGDGRAYEGRGWTAVGAHARSYNNVSIGISFIGTFVDAEPSEAQVEAAKWLIAEGVRLGMVAKDYVLLAHRQISPTESPGEKLFELMKRWPHWKELES